MLLCYIFERVREWQSEGKAMTQLFARLWIQPLILPHHNVSQGFWLHFLHVIIDHRDWWEEKST